MNIKMGIFSFTSILFISVVASSGVKFPEADLSTPELIKYWGYPAETHEARTSDGYILTLHRIPHGKTNSTANDNKERPVFFLQHALLCSSASWVFNLPRQSLGFVLADAGFDVWLGNVRGNTYSKKHVSLNVNSSAFWDFCFDEMAKYDLPAMIDYVLNKTHQKHVYYVGHSQGTGIAFSGLSENEELQSKIKILFALAPVTRVRHVNYMFRKLSSFEFPIAWLVKILDINEVMPSTEETKEFGKKFCPLAPKLCELVIFLINGYDIKNLNETRIPVYITHVPAGTSSKNIIHYFQLVNSKLFRKYDYGEVGNIKHYSSKVPPEYDVGKVKTSTVLIYGSKDSVVPPIDVEWTARHLPNVLKRIEVQGYNHMDFVVAINAREEIHENILNMARKAEGL